MLGRPGNKGRLLPRPAILRRAGERPPFRAGRGGFWSAVGQRDVRFDRLYRDSRPDQPRSPDGPDWKLLPNCRKAPLRLDLKRRSHTQSYIKHLCILTQTNKRFVYTFFQPDEDARIARCRGKVSTFRRIPKELVLLLLQFIRPFDPFFILAGRVQVQQAANDESVVVEKSVNRLGAVNRVGGIQYSNEPEKKENTTMGYCCITLTFARHLVRFLGSSCARVVHFADRTDAGARIQLLWRPSRRKCLPSGQCRLWRRPISSNLGRFK